MGKKSTAHDFDIAIVGAGPAGLSMACLLGKAGIRAALIDNQPLKPTNPDPRTTAISYGSSKILSEAGIWIALEEKSCAITDIQILDGDSPVLLRFESDEVEGKPFGWIAENTDMRACALAQIKRHSSITHLPGTSVAGFESAPDHIKVHLTQSDTLRAKLVIGADGRGSLTRELMGMGERSWEYGQRAIVCMVAHEHPHDGMAVEHFYPSGPFAALPMRDDAKGRHRSAVVLSEHGSKNQSLMQFDAQRFQIALQARFPDSYGEITVLSTPRPYPLNFIHARSYIGGRMALIADAAHGIHPIAGQGLNLGYRDVKALSDLLTDAHDTKSAAFDPGAPDLLHAYQRARRPDVMQMAAFTDGMVRLFSNNLPPLRLVRRIGLKAVSKLKPAKDFFMKKAMGD